VFAGTLFPEMFFLCSSAQPHTFCAGAPQQGREGTDDPMSAAEMEDELRYQRVLTSTLRPFSWDQLGLRYDERDLLR